MSATYNLRTVPEILAALKAALDAATWTPAGGDPEAAFQSVKLFGMNSLPDAMRELLVSQQRVCFVIPDSERFAPETDGGKMVLSRTLPVALLISDRVLGNRQTALFGGAVGATETPGAYGLQKAALEAVAGQLIDEAPRVVCTPTQSAVVDIEDVQKKLPGRAALEVDLDCTGGTLTAALGPGPNL